MAINKNLKVSQVSLLQKKRPNSKFRFFILKERFGDRIEHLSKGVNLKFWLRDVRAKGQPVGQDFIFKSNRGIFDDFGEVLYYRICKALGYEQRCVMAKQATVIEREDGEIHRINGVLMPSYIKASYRDIRVYSGKSFLQGYKSHAYDNKNGIEVSDDHTVSNYINALNYYKANNVFGDNVDFYSNIERRLKFLALLDYVLCQSDRHWENVEFMTFKDKDGNQKFKLSPFFDNGHIFNLHAGTRTVTVGLSYENASNKEKALQFFARYFQSVPMLGIETPTYETRMYKCENGMEKGIKLSTDVKKLQIFNDELASLLLKDPELMREYQKIKQLDFVQIIIEEFDPDEIPMGLLTAISIIASKRCEMLDEAIQRQENNKTLGDILDGDQEPIEVDIMSQHQIEDETAACEELIDFMNLEHKGANLDKSLAKKGTRQKQTQTVSNEGQPKNQDDGQGGQV